VYGCWYDVGSVWVVVQVFGVVWFFVANGSAYVCCVKYIAGLM